MKLPVNVTDDVLTEANKFLERNDLDLINLCEEADESFNQTRDVTLQLQASSAYSDTFASMLACYLSQLRVIFIDSCKCMDRREEKVVFVYVD
jgi:hypothetical protein